MAWFLKFDNQNIIKGVRFDGKVINNILSHGITANRLEKVFPLPARNSKNYPYVSHLPNGHQWDNNDKRYWDRNHVYPLSVKGTYEEPYFVDINATGRIIKHITRVSQKWPNGVKGVEAIQVIDSGQYKVPVLDVSNEVGKWEGTTPSPAGRNIVTFGTTAPWHPSWRDEFFKIDRVKYHKDINPLLGGMIVSNRTINIEMKHRMMYNANMNDTNGTEISTTFYINGSNNTINIYFSDHVTVMGQAHSGSDHIYAFLHLYGSNNTVNVWNKHYYENNYPFTLYQTFRYEPEEWRGSNRKVLVYCQEGNRVVERTDPYPYL